MSFKKLRIVLFLLVCVTGFSLNTVSASYVSEDQVTVGINETVDYSLPFNSISVKFTPIDDAKDYAEVKVIYSSFNNAAKITDLKETAEGKTADFKISDLKSNIIPTILHVTVKKTIW
jgi:hypothetical protein